MERDQADTKQSISRNGYYMLEGATCHKATRKFDSEYILIS